VGDAVASSKRSGKSTGLFARQSLEQSFAPLLSRFSLPSSYAKPGSAVVVPNTIWCAASRRHSFSRRCRVRSCPSGYIPGHCACNRSNSLRDVCHGSASNHPRSSTVTVANGSGRRRDRLGFALATLVGRTSPSRHAVRSPERKCSNVGGAHRFRKWGNSILLVLLLSPLSASPYFVDRLLDAFW